MAVTQLEVSTLVFLFARSLPFVTGQVSTEMTSGAKQ